MVSSTSNRRAVGVLALLMASAGACASTGGSPGGTGGGSGKAGAGGNGSGDAGQSSLTELEFLGDLSVAGEEWGMYASSCPSYHYQIRHFGTCATTTVGVVNGQPAERSFTSDGAGCNPVADAGDGDPARTVQQLLGYCETIVPSDLSKYTISFTYGFHGVPTSCSATRINCSGDCTTGFQVSDFSCDQIPAG
jgi:hypothetical protein